MRSDIINKCQGRGFMLLDINAVKIMINLV